MNNIQILNLEDTMIIIKNFLDSKLHIIIIMIAIMILSGLLVNIKGKQKKKKTFEKPKNDKVLINQNNIDSKEIIQKLAFEKLKELKLAKMNLDLKTIKNITNNEIFELYNRQIETLKIKNQKNIVQNIKYINSYITNIITTGNTQIINLRITIECYDFTMDNNNKIINGKYNKKIIQTYEIEIKRNINTTQNTTIEKLQLLYEREI